jgi:hypothetical protein
LEFSGKIGWNQLRRKVFLHDFGFELGLVMLMGYSRKFIFLLCCLSLPAMVAAQPQAKTAPRKASLDALIARVDSYWKLLQEQKKLGAAEFVNPFHREEFVARPIPAFSDPRVSSLELSPDRNSAKVTVIVKRIFPNQIMNWSVTEQWVFKTGTWYLQPETASLPMSGGAREKPVSLNAEQRESLRQELTQKLHFKDRVLDFGTVRQGTPVYVKLIYSLEWKETIPVEIDRSKPGSEEIGLKQKSFEPGQSNELVIEISTLNYDGTVNESLTLKANSQGIDVPFEISVQGNVYVPISLNPKALRFIQNEREKILLIRNNTKEPVDLKSMFTETNEVTIETLPATILPGQQLQLKFKKLSEGISPGKVDNVSISLAKPVDGVGGISIPVVLNYIETKRQQPDMPLEIREMEELLRKSPSGIPVK